VKSNSVISVPEKKRSASFSFHPSNSGDQPKQNDEQGEGEVKKIRFLSNQAVSKGKEFISKNQMP
jgi:hypothetical protein